MERSIRSVAWAVAGAAVLLASDSWGQTDGDRHETVRDASRFVTDRAAPMLELPADEDSFFFVVFGDRTGGPAEGIAVLEEAVRDTNLLEPDLVMTVGDLVEGYNAADAWMAQMEEFTGVMAGLDCPWFPVAGNHDIYWRGPDKPEGEHEAHYETHFGPLWYAFEHRDCWFIVLYTDESNPQTGEKNFNKPESQRMSPEQFAWLGQTLEHARNARHVFVFVHHPRWLGGKYGNDWQRVHEKLVEAGNVTAVFGGHIHRARYDGPLDGIEYVTLATVGGHQPGKAPEAGYLHHFDVVTVRDEHIALASIPVGGVQDVRAITGTVSADCGRLADARPAFPEPLGVSGTGVASGPVRIEIANPVSRPIEMEVALASADSRWSIAPAHHHAVLQPGETTTLEFDVYRMEGLDAAFRPLEASLRTDYLAENARFGIPEVRADVPLAVELPAPPRPSVEVAASFDGKSDHLRVESATIPLADGPMTLECWVKGRSFSDRVGLVTKTEGSEYGFFVNRGVPTFSIHLDGSYAEASAGRPILADHAWHHLAGVYDGSEVRLYVDGELVDRVERAGSRKASGLPLMLGADVTGAGGAMSHFDGLIDAVRLSEGARYDGDRFEPERRPSADARTVLLLNMDGAVGRWLYDESGRGAHPIHRESVELVPAG